MSKLWQLLPFLLVFGGVFAQNAKHCTINVLTDLPQKTPVILTENGLFKPDNTVTIIKENKSITLLCVGPNDNKVLALNQVTVSLTCQNGSFWYRQNAYPLRNMGCKAVPSSELMETGNNCAGGAGKVYNVGFTVNKIFYDIFTICFNNGTQRAIYSRNLINGKSARMKGTCDTPSFRMKGMDFNPNNYYMNGNQIKRFETLFGVNQIYLNNKTSFFARGHLAPNADFTFCYEQHATFYYANCAPEWQVVNSGNWVRVENAVRKLATSYGSDLLTFTGTLGVLELQHPTTSTLIEIYFGENKRVVAPKWFYKVVMHPQLPIDIVFVTLNNPFSNANKTVEFCKNVCGKHGLKCDKYEDAKRGYTFCCELNDFWATAMSDTTVTPYYELPRGWAYK